MRSAWLVVAALLAAGFAVHPVSAASKTFLEDPSGDTTLGAFGGPAPVPASNPQFASADLLSLDIQESDEVLTFVLGVAGFSAQMDSDLYEVHFDFRNVSYDAIVQHQVLPTGDGFDSGYLTATEKDDQSSARYYGYGQYVANLAVKVDASKNTLTFEVLKAIILDGDKRMPSKGDALTNVFVHAADQVTLFTGGASIEDRMPDADASSFVIAIGDESKGHLLLTSPDRVRVSNGGAATFVYKVTIKNTGEADDTVALALRDLPAGWNGTVQSPIKVPGNGEKTFSVLASVPFAHVHGGFSAFNLTAASQSDPNSASTLRLGILHTPIPQPTGHHSDLYIHPDISNQGLFGKVAPRTSAIMNTESPKPDEQSAEITMTGTSTGNGWWLPLNPGLQMGVDFDMNRTGTLAGSVVGHGPGTYTVSARLLLTRTDNTDRNAKAIVLAKSNSANVALDLSSAVPFSLQITPTAEADYVAYAPHQNLVLELSLKDDGATPAIPCCIGLANTAPTLKVDGFKMTLPLNEYADKLTGISEAASALDLKAEGVVEKVGRPGTLMTYTFTVTNTGFSADTFTLETAGTDARLGRLVPDGDIDLAPKESRTLTLGVKIPSNATEGMSYEVLVFAHAKTDPSKMAIARTKTTSSTTGEASSDETKVFLAAKDDAKKSPGPTASLVLGAVGVALLLAARRRKD